MKTLSVTVAARRFAEILDTVERDQEEVVLMRGRRQIARVVPEAPPQTAAEVFSDLHGILDREAGSALAREVARLRKRRHGQDLSREISRLEHGEVR